MDFIMIATLAGNFGLVWLLVLWCAKTERKRGE